MQSRVGRRARRIAPLLIMALSCGEAAWAAGGGHVVDDAAVETAGACHIETWVTRTGPGRGLGALSPACTSVAWPRVELGASLLHLDERRDETLVGPAIKWNLRPAETGLGVGLAATGAWSLRSDRLETAGLVAPVTLHAGKRLRVNINGGLLYSRSGAHRRMAFAGAQVEVQLTPRIGLMAEVFGKDRGLPGGQVGLRWTPPGGDFDLDLLAGRRVDGVAPSAITLGLTWRP